MNDTENRALLPCPMCGGTDLKIMGEDFKALLGGFHVYCNAPSCQCQGRHSGDRDKAVRAWNRRPSPTPPEGYVLVSVEPTPGLLMSMAIRGDHALGCPGYYDQEMFKANGHVSHQRTLEVAISEARKQHEEVVGAGFYSPEREAGYVAMLAARPEVSP